MLLVGLTGGLGAGKSTVARMLAGHGAVIVDADRLAREALEPGTRPFKEVCDLFGDQILAPTGEIDRRALAETVFADEEKRRALESITHPEVFRKLAEIVEAHQETDAVVVFDAPLILETGFDEACDVLVVVTASEDQQVARVVRERGMSEEEARARIASQVDPVRRAARADVVVRNDGGLPELERQVEELWQRLRIQAAEPR
ncbi:MAG TPA: dephospho-CoA kinase [Actinomycetota bacterium]|nr:dephospho-CoA kinase [Actinomycetota bacterium]